MRSGRLTVPATILAWFWWLLRWCGLLGWRLLRSVGRLCWRLFRRRRADHDSAAVTLADDGADLPSAVIHATPWQLFESIIQWDKDEAQQLCDWLNGYDRLLRQGHSEAAALDLRAIPTMDPAPFFPWGAPTNLVAIDRQGCAVVVNPAGVRDRYGVRKLSADAADV
ncbi:MAG: hypothetical protein HQL60_06220 [Magnetococcales bacterium]|nr:hypothetical protein [Magnetococcales bacterium]